MSAMRTALAYALTILGRRDYSTWELERKLEGKGYPTTEIGAAVARLREWKYLDDEHYLCRQIDKYLAAKKSRAYIRQRLILAGLDHQLVTDGLNRLYPSALEGKIVRYWWEKSFSGQPTVKEKRDIIKWARRLYAAGFPAEAIRPYLDGDKES